ncbi:MAG: hypothetical protein NTX64_09310 [Elusimicrobia bacterium]|nr:hypothetical protein [Elusimicrobiota bacterium]
MKLWRKAGARLDAGIERYTVGKDHRLDLELLPFDLQASTSALNKYCEATGVALGGLCVSRNIRYG